MSLKIGNVELKSNIILAPMAGYSDFAFRKMCLEMGAGLVCTEMISSSGLHYKNKKTEELLFSVDGEYPKAVQIFGHDPEIMAETVKNPLLNGFDIIDINMGCPAKKIISNGDGSALLNDFDLAEKIIKACVSATEKPITVKFRIGFYSDKIVAVEFAKICERAGASAITVHGRTTSQGYSGSVDYETIKMVKESVSIPVFASGDCKSIDDAKKIFDITNVDGIMVGRGALGKPEIFSELCLNVKVEVDKIAQLKRHYNMLLSKYSERFVVLYMRSHLAYYFSGKYKNTKALLELLKFEKAVDVFNFLDSLVY